MVGARARTALAGLAASLLLSVVLWWQFDSLAFFLFVPFVPVLFQGMGGDDEDENAARRCPVCGFRTTAADYDYRPRDGTRLVSAPEKQRTV